MGNEILIAKVGRAFNKVTRRFFGDTEVLLLKPSSDAEREFEVIHQITEKWFWNEEGLDFDGGVLEIAQGDELTEYINESSHLQINENVFEIQKNHTRPPLGTRVVWRIEATRYGRRANYASL